MKNTYSQLIAIGYSGNAAAGIEVVACRNAGRFFCWLALADGGSPKPAYKKTAGMMQLQTESPQAAQKKSD